MRRVFIPFAFLLALVLVFAGCGGGSKSKSTSANVSQSVPGAELAPASATAFVSIDWSQAQKFAARYPSVKQAIDSVLSTAKVPQEFKLASANSAAIEQALGKTVDFVVIGSGSTAKSVVLTDAPDSAKLKSALAASGSTAVVGSVGSWTAVAGTQADLDQAKAAAGGKLADAADFKDAMATLPSGALLRAYVPGKAISGITTATVSSGATSTILKNTIGKNKPDWIAVAASTAGNGLSIEGTLKAPAAIAVSPASSLMGELPGGVALAADLSGKSLGLDKLVTGLRNNPKYGSNIAQMEAFLGVKLEDLAALAGSEIALYGGQTGMGVLIKAPDVAKASALVSRIGALLSSLSSGKSTKTTIAGVQVQELNLQNAKLYLGISKGNLFVTTNAGALLSSSIGKLPSDSAYTKAMGALSVPSNSLGVVYLDFAGLKALAQSSNSLLKGFGGGSITTSVSGLENFNSLFGYATGSGDKVEFKAMLTMK